MRNALGPGSRWAKGNRSLKSKEPLLLHWLGRWGAGPDSGVVEEAVAKLHLPVPLPHGRREARGGKE